MARHIQPPEELARAALSAYDLSPETRVMLLTSGLTTTFEVVTADRRYVLRVHRPGYRTCANTRAELTFLRDIGATLLAADVDVPQPVPTRDGDLVVGVSDDQHCDLITWVNGEVRRIEDGLETDAVRAGVEALGAVEDDLAVHLSLLPGLSGPWLKGLLSSGA